MKNRFLFGMIHASVDVSVEELLNRSSHHRLDVYRLFRNHDRTEFYCPIEQMNILKRCFSDVQIIKCTGCMGFLMGQLRRPVHLIMFVWVIVLYFVLSHTLLNIEFQSTNKALESEISSYLSENKIEQGLIIMNESFDRTLKTQIKQEFMHKLSWIEVKRKASKLFISFSHKETVETESFGSDALISTKHAVVTKFEILHGYKTVKLNQVVHPGDVLVQPYLIDSKGNYMPLAVSGTVYGLTWSTVYSEIESEEEVQVFDFLRLLYACRKQIQSEIDEDEQVLKENILQVTGTEGKIRMIVHYTCIEDITKQ